MKIFMCFAALCCIFLILSDQYQGGTALKKKKIFKKLKEFLPLLLALKGKKKLLVLPLPIPIRINKAKKGSWTSPTMPWPVANAPMSWPSLDSVSYLADDLSWMTQPQSAPPVTVSKIITHNYLQPDYVQDYSSIKQKDYSNSYLSKDGLNYALNLGIHSGATSGYNSAALGKAYSGYVSSNYASPTYGASPYYEKNAERRPLASGKLSGKKPLFGQPSVIDEYENGKGSAPIYNDAPNSSKSPSEGSSPYSSPVENKVQFQKNVIGGLTYSDNGNNPISNNGYKSQNEIGYEGNGVRSVSSDYIGNQVDAVDNNIYEENNEVTNNENVKESAQPSYKSNTAQAIRL